MDIIKRLAIWGANLNFADREGSTALHFASTNKQASWAHRCIQCLVDAGADLKARDKKGRTPLYRALQMRCIENVKFLLSLGANPNVQDADGATPAHYAVFNGYTYGLTVLIGGGADVSIAAYKGYTPMHVACGKFDNTEVRLNRVPQVLFTIVYYTSLDFGLRPQPPL